MKADKEKPYWEVMNDNERHEVVKRDCKTCVWSIIIIAILFAAAYFLTSCSNDNDPVVKNPNTNYWQTRHDAIPEPFKGEWVSVTDKTEIVLNVTESKIMTADFTIDREQDNIVKVNDSILHMYQGGKFYALAFGVNGTMTITADNDCYDTVVPFEPVLPEPEPQEPVFN